MGATGNSEREASAGFPYLIYLNDLGLTPPRMFGSQDKVAHINKLCSSPAPERTWEGQHSDPFCFQGPCL